MKLSEKASGICPSKTMSLAAMTRKMKQDGVPIIDFGAGEPDFDTPQHIKDAAKEALDNNFTKYAPSAGTEELRSAIADKLKNDNGLNYSYNEIVVSNGSKHALFNAFLAILEQGDEVIIPAPYWLSYTEMVSIAGGVPVIAYTNVMTGYKATEEILKKHLSEKTKAIIINSPNNPTGMVYTKEELEKIADFAVRNDIYVISDEVYEKLIYSGKMQHISIASLNNEIKKRTIVVNGLSKSYAMTGWRVGYTASDVTIASAISNIQSHTTSNINSIALKAAYAALKGDQSCVEEMLNEFKHRRDYIYQRVSDIPYLSCLIPKGAFYLFIDISKLCGEKVDGKKIKDGADVARILLDKYNVAVVPGESFGYDDHIRISFAVGMEDIVEGIDRIENFVKDNF
ncbi:MAG: pyridoxal phosphate-dependent aminotransferase [Firmicutes bacterium]|nr:pyridoxal phosphate-dependent aminotransferase [Bacillota bacterium]